jgi:hypothetical protein
MTQSDLLQAASQLNVQELAEFVEQVTAIYQQRQVAERLDEATLLEMVHRSLPSDLQGRWNELIGKRDDACLTSSEYDELLQLTEQVEGFNVQRMAALSKLAQLRGLDLRSMMNILNLPIPSYA